jgi:hypothetical protein
LAAPHDQLLEEAESHFAKRFGTSQENDVFQKSQRYFRFVTLLGPQQTPSSILAIAESSPSIDQALNSEPTDPDL